MFDDDPQDINREFQNMIARALEEEIDPTYAEEMGLDGCSWFNGQRCPTFNQALFDLNFVMENQFRPDSDEGREFVEELCSRWGAIFKETPETYDQEDFLAYIGAYIAGVILEVSESNSPGARKAFKAMSEHIREIERQCDFEHSLAGIDMASPPLNET